MIQETPSFVSYGIADAGLIFDESNHDKYPIRYYNVINGKGVVQQKMNSYYVFIYDGYCDVRFGDGLSARMGKDTYFSHHGNFVWSGKFRAVVIEVLVHKGIYAQDNFTAMTHIGGVVEAEGRLKYIDGCTDSLLIPPVKKGNPCLNHLHFPPNTIQTPHTHPSHRIGVVIRGSGQCVTPFGNLPLVAGCIFVIKEYDGHTKAIGLDGKEYETGMHKFDTIDQSLDVIAFHPDSDFGAEDEFHPMINRTIVNGVSANAIDEIRTK